MRQRTVTLFAVTALMLVVALVATVASLTSTLSGMKYLAVGFVPPFGLVGPGFAKQAPPDEWPYWIAGFLAGMAFYAWIGWLLWRQALRRFIAACDGSAERGPLLDNRTTP